jgi:S1-C subfamily serine protease
LPSFNRERLSPPELGYLRKINFTQAKAIHREQEPTGGTSMLCVPSRILIAALVAPLCGVSGLAAAEKFVIPTLAPILRQVTPSVVSLSIKRRATPDEVLLSGAPDTEDSQVQVAASGVILDGKRGLIVTCAHQVTDADAIKVTLSDGRELTAEQLARDIETDVAVLKVAADNLVSIRFADSGKLHVGDFVISVGNPFGIGQSISFGVVSALRRSNMPIEGYDNLIQTDASMNPGDSGGALVNLNGELVGLDTAIVGLTGSNVGIGFAMPGNMVRLIAGELIAHGEVRRGHLGVTLRDLDPEIASALGLAPQQSGALITMVSAGSPADRAGIVAGDVITTVDRESVSTMPEARTKLGLLKPGEVAHITLLRSAEALTIHATLASPASQPIDGGAISPELAGAAFGPVQYFVPVTGAEVVSVETDSRAWDTGFRKGDIVRSLNQEPVTSPEQLLSMMKVGRPYLLFNIVRNGDGIFLVASGAATR